MVGSPSATRSDPADERHTRIRRRRGPSTKGPSPPRQRTEGSQSVAVWTSTRGDPDHRALQVRPSSDALQPAPQSTALASETGAAVHFDENYRIILKTGLS